MHLNLQEVYGLLWHSFSVSSFFSFVLTARESVAAPGSVATASGTGSGGQA